ncbi:MAG: isoleucine--tRNA ligase [Candidatus Helarchaeota archaeon]
MEYVKNELSIIQYWKDIDILALGEKKRAGAPLFNFIEGPPTANGRPGAHHVLARSIKDLINRFRFMLGYNVPRKAGWDCHGLPVEIEVEKELNLKSKKDILKVGIEKFNQYCRDNVFKYKVDWEKITERMGFWLDLSNPYMTLTNEFMESIWWSLKEIWKQNLLVEDYKIITYCPRCQTSLSSHEVALGYKKVEDPSIIVRFQLKNKQDTYFLAWTTTPWTLISNLALALNPDTRYVQIKVFDKDLNKEVNYILAKELLDSVFEKKEAYEIVKEYFGVDLVNQPYTPLYDVSTQLEPEAQKHIYRTINGDFVTTDVGTGIVHTAPAFGDDDFNIGKVYHLPVYKPVQEDGTFEANAPLVGGKYFKDADPIILQDLKTRKLLFNQGTVEHDYPFCWRCKTPLLYYADKSWFVKMTKRREDLLEFNEKINWVPAHLKYGRFGKFLDDIKDWALSRERYWGTPLPIWICTNTECNHKLCIGSVAELKEKQLNKDYELTDLHKPFIDNVYLQCPKCNAKMERVPHVIDCWYDSGAATFAQFHYPFENKSLFKKSYPYDFISEALDQTRGWFYTLHAIGTLVFKSNSYSNVICSGLITDEAGEKMSKSKGNVVDPWTIFDSFGADAFRWYFYSSSEIFRNKPLSIKIIKTKFNQFIVTFWNSYRYLKLNLKDEYRKNIKKLALQKFKLESPLHKWVISRINSTIKEATKHLSEYHIYPAAVAIENFVINDFSNWYIRLIRDDIKNEGNELILAVLIYIIDRLIRLIAPFAPFLPERIYLDSNKFYGLYTEESVHFLPYPKSDESLIDLELEMEIQNIQQVVQDLRGLRNKLGLKIRQPLQQAEIFTLPDLVPSLERHKDIITKEVNIKQLKVHPSFEKKVLDDLVTINYELVDIAEGDLSEVQKLLNTRDIYQLFEFFATERKPLPLPEISKDFSLTANNINFVVEARNQERFAASNTRNRILILDGQLTEELLREGFKRELIRRIQQLRKEKGLTPEKEKIVIFYEATPKDKFERLLAIIKDDILQKISGIKFVANLDSIEKKEIKKWTIQQITLKLAIQVQSS